eukprot:Nk52_evm2s1671 gene=Nk52_evmTU2s1671
MFFFIKVNNLLPLLILGVAFLSYSSIAAYADTDSSVKGVYFTQPYIIKESNPQGKEIALNLQTGFPVVVSGDCTKTSDSSVSVVQTTGITGSKDADLSATFSTIPFVAGGAIGVNELGIGQAGAGQTSSYSVFYLRPAVTVRSLTVGMSNRLSLNDVAMSGDFFIRTSMPVEASIDCTHASGCVNSLIEISTPSSSSSETGLSLTLVGFNGQIELATSASVTLDGASVQTGTFTVGNTASDSTPKVIRIQTSTKTHILTSQVSSPSSSHCDASLPTTLATGGDALNSDAAAVWHNGDAVVMNTMVLEGNTHSQTESESAITNGDGPGNNDKGTAAGCVSPSQLAVLTITLGGALSMWML